MTIGFDFDGCGTVGFIAPAGYADADDSYLVWKADTVAGRVTPAVAAADRIVGVNRSPADDKDAGSAIRLYVAGKVTVRTATSGVIAAGDSLEAAAGGKVVKKAAPSADDRLVALEGSSAADTLIQAVLR